MSQNAKMIEVTESTAKALDIRAAQRGLSVADFLAELTEAAPGTTRSSAEDIAELDQRWARAKTEGTVANDEVVAWLDSWGKADFRPWSTR